MHKREWEKSTIKRDLTLMTTEQVANAAWSMMTDLHIAANYEELSYTRQLLSHKKVRPSEQHWHTRQRLLPPLVF